MFAILRYLVERIRDFTAKKSLEEKLGRKVDESDIYSLKTNLEAAHSEKSAGTSGLGTIPSSGSDALTREPMSKTTKLIAASVAGLVLFVGGAFLVIMMMPEATYNGLNPFTPKVAAGAFPATIGDYELKEPPTHRSYRDHCKCYGYSGIYKKGAESVSYNVYTFDTPEVARKNFEDRSFIGGTPQVTEQTGSRQVVVDQKVGNVVIQLINDKHLVFFGHVKGGGVNFEKNLPYAALGLAQPGTRSAAL